MTLINAKRLIDPGHAWVAVDMANLKEVAAIAEQAGIDLLTRIEQGLNQADPTKNSRMTPLLAYLEDEFAWPAFAKIARDMGFEISLPDEAQGLVLDPDVHNVDDVVQEVFHPVSPARYALVFDADIIRRDFLEVPVYLRDHHDQPVPGKISEVGRADADGTPCFVVDGEDGGRYAVPVDIAGANLTILSQRPALDYDTSNIHTL